MAVKNDTTRPAVKDDEGSKPADIAPGTEMEASGAIIEEAAKKVDLDHPAVDNNPRADTTVRQNQIDFNDPAKPQKEAVEENLGISSGDTAKSKKGEE
jgi:hypothetical protein